MSRPKVLLVEDDIPLQAGIRDVLELDGYNVITASNGARALEMMQEEEPDLVLSDIMMPEMDGLSFCKSVRERAKWANIPLIFMTAKGQKVDIRAGMHVGADDYITKPFEMQDLLQAVQARLQRAAKIRENTARQISHLRANILRVISHEFRTPLTFVKGYSELLEEVAADLSAEELGEFLHSIKSGSDRLSSLIDDLLFLLSLETGEAKLAYQYGQRWLDLGEIVEQAVEIFQARSDPDAMTIAVHRVRGLPPIRGHREYVLDLFERLLDNALKFAKPEGGHVDIEGFVSDEQICVSVADDGVGMPPEELDQIFQKFYQVDRESYEQQGTGIGLCIAHGIMALHGGEIKVRSKLGKGSRFTLCWPRLR
jgi:signal transduction histidine kinase